LRFRGQRDAVAIARATTDDHKLAHEVRPLYGDVLGDHGADGEAKDIDYGEAERMDKDRRAFGHLGEGSGNFSRGPGDPSVVEEDHFAVVCEAVSYGRVPAIHAAEDMRNEDKGRAFLLAEASIGEAYKLAATP
jgi:hypothetical protein